MERFYTECVLDTESIGEKFAETLKPGDVAALFGGIGMGKTAFVRGMARGLGIADRVSSPTYSIVHEYRGETNLIHFDMYRVDNWDALYSTNFFEYLESGAVIAVEWSENIENALPDNAYKIFFELGEEETERIIKIYKSGEIASESSCDR